MFEFSVAEQTRTEMKKVNFSIHFGLKLYVYNLSDELNLVMWDLRSLNASKSLNASNILLYDPNNIQQGFKTIMTSG